MEENGREREREREVVNTAVMKQMSMAEKRGITIIHTYA